MGLFIFNASCYALSVDTNEPRLIVADKIESDISEKGGILRFRYMTDLENAPLGEIEFDITLNPIG